jgi:hypothetical protein
VFCGRYQLPCISPPTTVLCECKEAEMPFDDDDQLNPSSPAGQIRSIGAFADGLTRLRGWRRTAARWIVFLALAMPPILWVVFAGGRPS